MQNYQGNTNDCMRRGNYGRSSRNMNCQTVVSTPVFVSGECEKIEKMPIAMAYVPWQKWRNIYSPEQAFMAGTIFEELHKPFYGKGGCRS